jgi:hypothetical protein
MIIWVKSIRILYKAWARYHLERLKYLSERGTSDQLLWEELMSRLGVFLLFLSAMLALHLSAQAQTSEPAETRVALVIGNGDYRNVPLKNPANDAQDIAGSLKTLGFTVSLAVDSDLAGMMRAIRDFGNSIRDKNTVALFYYSGHGVQYQGANYLIPSKSDIQESDELPYLSVNADFILSKMQAAGDKLNIVILDACRNNPFIGSDRSGERGLTVVSNALPPDSLIVYATAPGRTADDGEGRNGLFTSALLKHLADPNIDVEMMVRRVREEVVKASGGKQVPWNNSSLSGNGFYLVKKAVLASIGNGGSTRPASPAHPAKATSTLTLNSDPPGIKVVIDDASTVLTPASVELPAGAHSFTPQQSVAKDMYYRAEPKQWITLSEGMDVSVPLHPKSESGTIAIKNAPAGFKIIVNGEEKGETPIQSLPVKSGKLEVRFEKDGLKPRLFTTLVMPGNTRELAWGETENTAIPIARRTVSLDGRTDSWQGIQPLYEADSSSFMGNSKYGLKRLYMCRDDTYLYWRIDFQNTNPLREIPKGIDRGVGLFVGIKASASVSLNLGISYFTDHKGFYLTEVNTWDSSLGKSNSLVASQSTSSSSESVEVAYNSTPVLLEGRVRNSRVADYISGIHLMGVQLFNHGKGAPKDVIPFPWFYADFSQESPTEKAPLTVLPNNNATLPNDNPGAKEGIIELHNVPSGIRVFANDVGVGTTAIHSFRAPEGKVVLRFERAGEDAHSSTVFIQAGETKNIWWGAIRDTAVEIPRKTIILDGKPDSWNGVEPLIMMNDRSFMGEARYGMTRFYVSKDDNYFYWRVDFQTANPLYLLPKDINTDLYCLIKIPFDEKILQYGITHSLKENKDYPFGGIYDSRYITYLGNEPQNVLDCYSYSAMVEGRVSLKRLREFCHGILPIQCSTGGKGYSLNTPAVNINFADES